MATHSTAQKEAVTSTIYAINVGNGGKKPKNGQGFCFLGYYAWVVMVSLMLIGIKGITGRQIPKWGPVYDCDISIPRGVYALPGTDPRCGMVLTGLLVVRGLRSGCDRASPY